jgi:small nuclear ribonucleoprotein (snRNP)-like protein
MSNPPPISLGKPSLRHRLESYYSLVAPSAIQDAEEWKRKFEIIYAKYGGNVEGETKLSAKLAKKYGNHVRLLVAPARRSMRDVISNDTLSVGKKHDEKYYEMNEYQLGSKILDFTSDRFDAAYALIAPVCDVLRANPHMHLDSTSEKGASQTKQLDNISKFRSFLPKCDPEMFEPRTKNTSKPINKEDPPKKKASMFLSLVSKYEDKRSGPLSLLYSIVANRQRARVMVRYVDCVRGTLTGYLIAFDKHFNMIMRDVDEVYGGRITQCRGAVEAAGGSGHSLEVTDNTTHLVRPPKGTLEAQRRKCYPPDGSGGPGPAIKQRYFHQLLVRGDNVVMVWKAESERSAHPLTKKSPSRSAYEPGTSASVEVGTPGSLFYALQRWENQNGSKRR